MKEIVKYCVVGTAGVVINLFLVYVLTELLGIWYMFSAIIGFFASVSNNFILNKMWTFKNKVSGKKNLINQYGKFFSVSLIGLTVNLVFLYLLKEFAGLWYLYSQLIAIVIATSVNFTGNKYWTFGDEA